MFISNLNTKELESFIYIATTKQYAQNNQFKIGTTANLKKRLLYIIINKMCEIPHM